MSNKSDTTLRREAHMVQWAGGTITYLGGTIPSAGVLALLDHASRKQPVDLLAVLRHLVGLCGAIVACDDALGIRHVEQLANECGYGFDAEFCGGLYELAAVAHSHGGNVRAVNDFVGWVAGRVVP